ncbi:hypothetical protein A6A08_14775 [Nocardiopsis sp. TSRI0078]|uniref:hypothetical protein n=1 Tax=unclassified Nocardiopsis TaxID=2649073 RepID=UPI000969500E|nr:hypothetical protein [Nocardiopsis sp. TSRI0078]OKI13549.1 hypothetical protein A6A08_14775 [Nocardiopsis sp. TSRI0078]
MTRKRKRHHLRRRPDAWGTRPAERGERRPRTWDFELIRIWTWVVASVAMALALFGAMGGMALNALVHPLVADAAFALGGRTAEARVTGVVEGEARVAFTVDGERVETAAIGTYDPRHDPRDVEVRYLAESPHDAALAGHDASWAPALLSGLALGGPLSWLLVRTWYRSGTPPALRARLRRQAPALPVVRWAVPAVLCLCAGALLCAWPYLNAAPEEMVRLDPSFTWFAAGTAVLLAAVPLAWRAVARHAALNRAALPARPHSPAREIRVKAAVVLGCLLVLVGPGHLLAERLRNEAALSSGPTVRGTVEAVDKSSRRGCWFSVRVSYRMEGLPHERTLSVRCPGQRGHTVGHTVLLETSSTEPTLVRIADRPG